MNMTGSSSPLTREPILPDILFAHEPLMRLAAFAGIFAVMALWEVMAPRRRQAIGRLRRWPGNLGIVVIDTLLVRLLFPTAAVGVALLAESRGWGLLHCAARAALVRRARRRGRARPRDLSSARAVSCRAGAVAAAPHASRRSRIRCDDRARVSIRSRSCCRWRSSSASWPRSARRRWRC